MTTEINTIVVGNSGSGGGVGVGSGEGVRYEVILKGIVSVIVSNS